MTGAKPAIAAALLSLLAAPAVADDLYKGGNWSSLATDRKASQVGDMVTIQVMANNSASNTVSRGGHKKTALSGDITATKGTGTRYFERSGTLSVGSDFDGQGTNARVNRMAAQLGATVTAVLPNGDLVISGWQTLRISGERTQIRITGRVRPEDVSTDNVVVSSRLADAHIEYEGKGFASDSAKPGLVTRIFSWLGVL